MNRSSFVTRNDYLATIIIDTIPGADLEDVSAYEVDVKKEKRLRVDYTIGFPSSEQSRVNLLKQSYEELHEDKLEVIKLFHRIKIAMSDAIGQLERKES